MDYNTQRNNRDVAVELTKIYADRYALIKENALEEKYAKFYALSTYLSDMEPDQLKALIPEEILSKITNKNW